MTIGELAKRVEVNIQTIRYYERKELLPAAHRWAGTGHRDFSEDAVKQMRFIQSAKTAGFTLREIRELLDMRLLPSESCEEVHQLMESKINELDQRMKAIRHMRQSLAQMAQKCRQRSSGKACPALWEIAHASRSRKKL